MKLKFCCFLSRNGIAMVFGLSVERAVNDDFGPSMVQLSLHNKENASVHASFICACIFLCVCS